MVDRQNSTSYKIEIYLLIFLFFSLSSVYFRAMNYGFISLDDPGYVYENFRVQKGLSVDNVIWAFKYTSKGDGTYWHPLTWISHMADCQFFGLNASGHHAANLFLHIINSYLLFLFFRISTNSKYKSLLAAFVFGLHPIHVESVVWVAARKNLLSTFFLLLTMLIYLWYQKKPGIMRYTVMSISFILGLLSKPMIITLPCVLLLIDFWPLNRLTINPKDFKGSLGSALKLIKEKLPLFAISIFWTIISVSSIRILDWAVPTLSVPMSLRFSNAIISYMKYVLKLLWPFKLSIFYPYPDIIPLWEVIVALFILISLSCFILKKLNTYPWLIVGWLWYLGTLVPVSGLSQAGLWPALADRWAYVPSIGIVIIIVWGLADVIKKKSASISVVSTAALMVFLFSLYTITWIQTGYWSGNITLFQHALRVTRNNAMAHNDLGAAFMGKGDLENALRHYNKAIQFNPNFIRTYNNIGLIFQKKGNIEQAMKYYHHALKLKPNFFQAHHNLGLLYHSTGERNKAVYHYTQAVQFRDHPDTHNNLGLLLFSMEETDIALNHMRKASENSNHDETIHYNYALMLEQKGRTEKAIEQYLQALQIQPNYADAHMNLGIIFAQKNLFQKAIRHFHNAAENGIENVDVYNNLGTVYASAGDVKKAIEYYNKAIIIAPERTDIRNNIKMLKNK